MANSKIEAALKAREQRNTTATTTNTSATRNGNNLSPYYAEKKNAYDTKIQTALNARRSRIQANLPNKISELESRLQAEIDAYNASSGAFGEGAFEKTVKSQTTRRANISKLAMEIEAYKPYLEEESANSLLELLSQMKGGYDAYVSMSQFDNEDDYNKAVRFYGYEQQHSGKSYTDLRKSMEQMDSNSEEYKWLDEYSKSDDVMTVEDYKKLIYQTETKLNDFLENEDFDATDTNSRSVYDKTVADYEAELERLRAGQWRVENKEKYGGLSENADFKKQSQVAEDGYTAKIGLNIGDNWIGVGDPVYDYINDLDNAQKRYEITNDGSDMQGLYKYSFMNDTERSTYNYLYNTEGKKAAKEYLDYLGYELDARRLQQISTDNAEFAKEHPVLASAYSVPTNLMSGIGYLDVAGQNAVKGIKEAVTGEYAGPINYNSWAMTPSVASTSIRGTVAEDLAKKGAIELDTEEHPILSRIFNGKTLGDAYQLGMSMADSTAVALLTPIVGSAGTVLLGGSAATQGVLDAVANGATDGQALTIGIINGAAEWAFEKIGVDNLVNKIIKGDKGGIVRAFLSQGLSEGGEELGTSLVNNIADYFIMAEKSGYSKLIAQYVEQGLSKEEAAAEALKDITAGMVWDFVGGFATGGIMGTSGHAIGSGLQSIAENAEAKQLYGPSTAEIVSEALEYDPDNKLAKKIQTKLKGGKEASGGQLLNLVNQRDKGAIAKAAEARLTALGETGDVKALSTALAKQAAGEKLTKAEQQTISKSKYGKRVSNELNPENIRSGEFATDWAENIGTKRINVAEYSRLVAEAQVDAVAKESSVTEAPQIKPATVAENATVTQEPVAVAENAKTTETAQTPAKATTIEEASKKYGAQAGAMLHTYHAGQDVAKYDAAYSIAFEMGKEGVNPDYVKKSEGTSYLSETQVQLAYEAGQAAVSEATTSEVSNTSEGMALIKDTVAKLGVSTEATNELVSKYDSSTSAEAYAAGIEEAFQYGQYDTFENMEADKELAKALTAEQRKAAFELGQKAKENKVKSEEAAIKKTYEKAKVALSEGKGKKAITGKVIFEDKIKKKSLTPAQRAVVDESQIISAALGVNVHIYSGMTEYGRCDMETGDIWLNVNANISGQTLMQTTLSHELVHTAKRKTPGKFQAFADFLVNEYSKKGVSVKELMLAKQQEYAENGIELTLDEAFEEVIAEAASNMLTDSNAVERLAELNKDHPDIVKMIKDFLQDLLKRIQELFGHLPADSYEAQLVREMEQETQKALQNLFADMLVDAGEHNKTITKAFGNNTTIETNAEGEFLLAKNNGESESPAKFMFNAATWERGGRDTLEIALRNEGFSAKDVKAALTIMDAKYELVKQLGQEYTEQGRINQIQVSTDIKDGKSVVSALVTNGDYPVNIDLLMVCKKRQAYQKVINRLCETGMIQKATVDSLAIAEINKILGKYGFETACLGCFVESRRLRVQEWAETICKEWNAEVKKRNPNAGAFGFGKGEASLTQEEVMQLVAELESGEKNDQGNLNLGKGSAVKRMGVLMDKVPSLQKTLTVEDLITPDGLTALRRYDSNLFSMVKSRYGSNSPKYVQDFKPYNSELAKYGKVPSEYKNLREYLYAIGGARMQSFSDFIVENWFDYTQIVADLAARKLPMHTYTKEIALVKLFGMTGIKINMSLIPDIDRSLGKDYAGLTLNENGEYELIWADKDRFKATGGKTYMQSINFADAIALQEDPRYSANVGTIAVGISDNHILKMLDDPRIRMVIPYHSSGMNPIYADMVGSSYYKDYTMTQNTTVAYLIDSKGNRKTLKLTKEQAKKLTAGFEFNQTLQELGDARATAEAYKEWCKDASKHTITIGGENYTAVLTPKFNQFATHENYYKLLEDFNTYDCITEQAAPQGDVTQTYPEAFEDILREEVQAREDYRQKQEPKFDDAMAEIESFLEHHSKADSVYYAEQRGIKLGAKDKKLNAAEKAKLSDLRSKDKGKSMYRMPPKKTMRDLDIDRTFIDYGDVKSEIAAIDKTVESLIARGKTVTVTAEETEKQRNAGNWDSKKEARKHLKDILRGFHGKSVFFNHKGVRAEAYLTKEGFNHSSVGINTPERAGAFSKYYQLIANAEYSYSSENDPHSNANKRISGKIDWDCFVAVAMVDGEPYPIVFKIRTIDQDIRSQVYKMATKNEIGSIHDHGQQENLLDEMSDYDGTPISDDSIAQTEGDFKSRISGEASLNTRQLLANAFESVAQNDIEREKIQQYKEKIDLVNAQEQKLRELRAEIKDLSFTAGPKDTARIRKLQDEATKTANRINIYDKQLLQLEASKPLQAVVEREKAKAIKRVKQKAGEAKAAAKIGRDKTAMRHKIKNVVNDLNDYLLKGTKDKHVMIGLQKAVASALDVVNMDTIGAEERIAKLEAELMKAKTPEKIQEISRRIDNVRAQGDKMSKKLANLKAAYAEIKDSSDPLIANSHDDVIEAAIESVAKSVGETPLRDMTLSQLQDVYDLYKMVLTTIRNSNKTFKADKKLSIDTLASNVQAEVEEVGGKKKHLKLFEGVNSFLWNNFKPVYAFKAIGSKTFSKLFDNVRAGEDVWARDVSEAKAFYLEQSKKYGYDGWNLEETHSFKSTSGMDFKLTLEQMMSLYAYSKRKQAEDHLKYGGIVFEDSFETKKLFGKFEINLKTEDATAYNISPETLAAITGALTADQKGFVDAMQDYLSTTMGEKGNEVSLEMYGVKLFKEKFYFPLKSAPQYMAKAREQAKGEVKIKNSGFTKETNPKAKNPIVLESFMNVWANHVNDMSMYHAFTLPLEDFYRVYNYRTPSVNENMPTEGVNPAIQNAYGKAATNYVEQLLKDLNGGARSDPTAGFINKMMGLFKKGAVFASASVVVQQPSAVARAMALIDSKYFVGKKLDDHKHKALWEEVKQYAPVAMIKEMGYFDTNMGMSTVDFIKAKEYESWDEKMKALVVDSDYRDEALSKAPALADEIAWCMIWEAVKRETVAKHPALKVDSDELLQLAGVRFTEVIVNTQVYDSVLSRSANMRSKDTGMKMATAFLAEPTTTINMIADALIQGKRGDTTLARKAIGAAIASQILNGILVSFVYAARDDDEEKTYWEKYFATVLAEVKDSFNLATYIPFVKDIVSIVQGYDVERSDIAVIADLWKAYEQLDSDKISGWRKAENFVGGIAQLFGLPVKNIMRDARALYQTLELAFSGEHFTWAGAGYAVKEALSGETISNGQQLYEAILNEDKDHIDRVAARFEDQAAVDSAISKALRENDSRVHEAAAAKYSGDFDRYKELFYEIKNEGNFEFNVIMSAINAETTALEKAEQDEETGYEAPERVNPAESVYDSDDYYAAIINGKTADAKKIYGDLIAEKKGEGYLTHEAEDAIESAFTSDVKNDYMDGKIKKSKALSLLTAYGGKGTDSEAEVEVEKWNFELEQGYSWGNRARGYRLGDISESDLKSAVMEIEGEDIDGANAYIRFLNLEMEHETIDITASDAKSYFKYAEPEGIDVDVYLDYKGRTTGIKGVDADGDGETDANSVKNQILPIIDSLPLTVQQKDALYLARGWAQSGLKNTPWHQ